MISSIGEILGKLPVKDKVREYGLWKAWNKLAGEGVSRHCQPENLRDGILFLKVDSPVWMQQLQFLKAMILEKVNGYMGDNPVREIRFRIGKLSHVRKAGWKPWEEMSLPQELVLQIDRDLSQVRDEELRNIIRKLRLKEAQVKLWRVQRRMVSSVNSPR